jgi:hypothetical protein
MWVMIIHEPMMESSDEGTNPMLKSLCCLVVGIYGVSIVCFLEMLPGAI